MFSKSLSLRTSKPIIGWKMIQCILTHLLVFQPYIALSLVALFQNLTSASSIDNEQTSCRNPYHDKWGNNDSNYRWPSQVPAVAQSVFRLLGYERAPGSRSKFCETCITRATCLTDEEVTEITRQAKLVY